MNGKTPRFDGKVALVTGASRGIGRAIAKGLVSEGAHVIALARTKGGLEELDDEMKAAGAAISLIRLDLTDGPKIDALGPSLYQRWQKLDIFVANAGILGPLSPLGHISEADWSQTLNINLTANWRLLRTLDPLLRLSPAGRVLFLTSGAAQNCRAYWGPYSVSKAALEALAKTYANEAADSALRVNLLNPGPMRTRMRSQAFPGEDPASLPPADSILPLALKLLSEETEVNGQRFDFRSEAGRCPEAY
jgi:NAD(P)-dependent dehydrogenase (short-subunit alcohol dehydrogenase family)